MTDRDAATTQARRSADERAIGRLLIVVTYIAVALLVLGVIAMIAAGISPLDPPPAVDIGTILGSAAGLKADGLLWFGLIVVMATPILRVMAAALAYGRGGEWRMVGISIAILAVIAAGVATALATEV